MKAALADFFGEVVDPASLASRMAILVRDFLASDPELGVTLLETRRNTRGLETLIIETRPDLVQRPVHDIRACEALAVVFGPEDGVPSVMALRDDFPAAPHTNDTPPGFPLSLCLYREPWSEIRLQWTPGTFLQRIRWWLESTAEGELYGGENPVEPLFFSAPRDLIVSRSRHEALFQDTASPGSLIVRAPDGPNSQLFFLQDAADDPRFKNTPLLPAVFLHVLTPVVGDGRVRVAPQSVDQLAGLLAEFGFDLATDLRLQLRALMADEINHARNFGLVVAAQIAAAKGGASVHRQLMAFLSACTIAECAIALGEYEAVPGGRPGRVISPNLSKSGAEIGLAPLNVGLDLDPAGAAVLSGQQPTQPRIVLVGAGSLGSSLFDALWRQGYGDWTIVDKDILRPHNLPRHLLVRSSLGRPKAHQLASWARAVSGQAVASLAADFMEPVGDEAKLRKALDEAELILDASASAGAARAIARDASNARRISVFFLGDASAAAILVEDHERTSRLDDLEAVLVGASLTDKRVAALLAVSPTQLPTPASCRAPTGRAPWNRIQTLSGLAAAQVRSSMGAPRAGIAIYKWQNDLKGVDRIDLEVAPFKTFDAGRWRVRVSTQLIDALRLERSSHLPAETGGVLLGAVDAWNETIHIVAQAAGFGGSHGTPTSFQRGLGGLANKLAEVSDRTRGALVYVGEWHSHPRGASSEPSGADFLQADGLAEMLRNDHRPAVSLIISENEETLLLVAGTAKS